MAFPCTSFKYWGRKIEMMLCQLEMGCWPSFFSGKTSSDHLLSSITQHTDLTLSHIEDQQTFPKSSRLPQTTHSSSSTYTTSSLDTNSPTKLLAHCSQCLKWKWQKSLWRERVLFVSCYLDIQRWANHPRTRSAPSSSLILPPADLLT